MLSSQSVRISHFATDSQPVNMAWRRAPSGAHDHIFVNRLTVTVLSYSGALSDERSGLSFVSHSLKPLSICCLLGYDEAVLQHSSLLPL
jgi:hypothetical protein